MSVVEPNSYWDGIIDGFSSADEEFGDILNILDFPMESLECAGIGGDWDASKCQNLGPIPSNTLTGLTPVLQGNAGDIGSANRGMPTSHNALIEVKCAQKELPKHVKGNRGGHAPHGALTSSESSAFQTPSPTSVLESSGSCTSGKTSSIIKPEVTVPVRARSKRPRPSSSTAAPTTNPWLLLLPIPCPSKRSSNTGRSKRNPSEFSRKKLPREQDTAEKKEEATPFQQQRSTVTKKCTHCEVTKTPQWREGPLGPKTLCNACGVRYRSGRLFPEYRPAASPTFLPSLHSNSHKKVIEMRTKAIKQQEQQQQAAVPPLQEEDVLLDYPLPEFVPMSSYLVDYMC